MDGRWTIFISADGELAMSEIDDGATYVRVPAVPCDDAAIDRVARTLCRQRGYSWDDASDGLRLALIAAAKEALQAAGETP